MEELLHYLSQAQNPDENVQKQLYNYTCSNIKKIEFGSLIFELFEQDLSNSMFVIISGLLRNWAFQNWEKLGLEAKHMFFEKLKNFIIQNHRFAVHISNIFIDVAKKEFTDSHIFEPIIFEIFKNIQLYQNLNHLLAMMNLVGYMAKRYKYSSEIATCEISLLLQKIIDTTFIFFDNLEFLQTIEGCEIMQLVLSSFMTFFFKCKPSFEFAITPLNYVQNTISLYISQGIIVKNVSFIGYCLRFYGKFIEKFESCSFISEKIPLISQLINNLLLIMLRDFNNNSYVIATILETIILLEDKICINNDVINLVLNATKLSQQDVENFDENPLIYYIEIYSKKFSSFDKLHPRILSCRIISNFLQSSKELAIFLLKSQPEEYILRCISFSFEIYEQYEMIPQVLDYLKLIFPLEEGSPEFLIAKLDLIKSCVPFFDYETKLSLINTIPSLLNTNQSLIQIFASRLLISLMKNDVIPDEYISQILINLLPYCPTNHVSKALTLMVKAIPNIVLPQSEIVVSILIEKIKNEMFLLNSNDLDEDYKANEDIEQNIILISQVINSAGKSLVNSEILNIIYEFLNQDDSQFLCYIIPLYKSILDSGSQYIQYFFSIFFESYKNNTKLFIENFDDIFLPIFSFISKFPKIFLELNISNTLIHLLTSIFDNPCSFDIIFMLSGLISWIIQLDSNVDIETTLEIALILHSNENDISSKICSMNIYASCYVMKRIKPDLQIINEMIELNHFFFQKYQKHLFAFLFLYLAANDKTNADNFLNLSFKLISDEYVMRQMNEKQIQDYFDSQNYPDCISTLSIEIPYLSPIEQRNYNEVMSSSLQNCSSNALQHFKQQFPMFFK